MVTKLPCSVCTYVIKRGLDYTKLILIDGQVKRVCVNYKAKFNHHKCRYATGEW